MKKNLRKNKKGFTLVEVIVVLLIIGILLAITIPSVYGYITKANDARDQANARTGFLAAQTIAIREHTTNNANDAAIVAAITPEAVAHEIGQDADATITDIACTVNNAAIQTCNIIVADGRDGTHVHFEANGSATTEDGPVGTGQAGAIE